MEQAERKQEMPSASGGKELRAGTLGEGSFQAGGLGDSAPSKLGDWGGTSGFWCSLPLELLRPSWASQRCSSACR